MANLKALRLPSLHDKTVEAAEKEAVKIEKVEEKKSPKNYKNKK